MTEFAIFVAVKLKPGMLEQYLPLIEVDRASALSDEPGCRHFDILRPEEGGDVVHLYEVYDDEEAFKAHQASPHFTHYAAATETMVEERVIQRLSRISQ